jgi:hypothetical protein
VYETKGFTLGNLKVSVTNNLKIAEYDGSSTSFRILKSDTGHGLEKEECGQLHVSATLPPRKQLCTFFIQGCGGQENLPLQGYETRIVQAVG